MPATTWSAPVRFVEVDAQDVVFNAHYLTWCDEAMNQFFQELGGPEQDFLHVAVAVRLVTSTLTWRSSARWGDVVDVEVTPSRVGTSSLGVTFAIRVGDRECCTVETVYVHVGEAGQPTPLPDDVRTALTAPVGRPGHVDQGASVTDAGRSVTEAP